MNLSSILVAQNNDNLEVFFILAECIRKYQSWKNPPSKTNVMLVQFISINDYSLR